MDTKPQLPVIYLRPRGAADPGARWADPTPRTVIVETATDTGWTGWPAVWGTTARAPVVYPAFAWEEVPEHAEVAAAARGVETEA